MVVKIHLVHLYHWGKEMCHPYTDQTVCESRATGHIVIPHLSQSRQTLNDDIASEAHISTRELKEWCDQELDLDYHALLVMHMAFFSLIFVIENPCNKESFICEKCLFGEDCVIWIGWWGSKDGTSPSELDDCNLRTFRHD